MTSLRGPLRALWLCEVCQQARSANIQAQREQAKIIVLGEKLELVDNACDTFGERHAIEVEEESDSFVAKA